MDDAEYLSRLQAAYFHLQALVEHVGNDPNHPLVVAREVVAQVYMRACVEQDIAPWDIKPWTEPANRSRESPPP